MTATTALALVLIAALVGAVILANLLVRLWLHGWRQPLRSAYDDRERSRMPAELATAELVLSERVRWRWGLRPMVAKTDQVYRTTDGWLVPVETKARSYHTPSDLVQLSVQAQILRSGRRGEPVADWGYVRLAPKGQPPRYERVPLLAPRAVEVLYDRWQQLRAGVATPSVNPAPHRCRNCALRDECPDAAA